MSPLAFGIGKSGGASFDPAAFYCNYLAFLFHWTDGKDLDVICSFLSPNLSGELGFNRSPGNAITNGDTNDMVDTKSRNSRLINMLL